MSARIGVRGPRPDDAAIVGMGAIFPGAADPGGFWRLIESGGDAITDVPASRWDPALYYAPGTAGEPARSDRFYCRRGGFVDELATFDPVRFGIMPAVVAGAEPDQLLALRAGAEAIADAGGEARLPDRSRVGVIFGRGGYMGVATARLDQRVRTAHQLTALLAELAPELSRGRLTAIRAAFQDSLGPERPEASIGLVPSFTASRIANRLDLGGPAYTLDAACATSLLVLDQAAAELRSGRCDAVLAGAVHHCHIATLWSVFTQLRALSASERIRPFDRAADGTLISEGTGAVLLKRFADAERDGDRVYAVVRGIGISSDGRAASLLSPLVDGQVRALEQAWQAAELDPTTPGLLGLLEAHGTGTPVGDEAELATLGRVFGPRSGNGAADVALGTVKSNIGHTMQASGMAGLIKATLALHHRTLPPTLHVRDPHPALTGTRMRPQDRAETWPVNPAGSRLAAINAFGFGGVNAHAVLEQPPTGVAVALPTEPARALAPATESTRTVVPPAVPARAVTPPTGSARAVSPPAEPSQPVAPPAESDPAGAPPTESNPTDTQSAEPARPNTRSAGSVRAVTPGAESDRAVVAPAEAGRAVAPSVGSVRTATQAAESTRAVTPPTGSGRAVAPPAEPGPIDAQSAGADQAVTPPTEPGQAVTPSAESHRPVAPSAEAHRALAPPAEPGRADPQSTESTRAVTSSAVSGRAVAPPADSDHAGAPPTEPDRADTQPPDSDRAVTQSAESKRSAAPPAVGSAPAVVPPAESAQAVVPPVGSVRAARQSARSDRALVPTDKSSPADAPPAESDRAVALPARSDRTVTRSAESTRVVVPPPESSRGVGPIVESGRGIESDVLALAAGSVAELARMLGEVAAGRAASVPIGAGPCRLAVANPTRKRLALAARAVERGVPWRGRAEIWFTPRPLLGPYAPNPGRVAFLFPGLEPEISPRLDDLADACGRPRPELTGAEDLVGRAVDALTAGRFLAAEWERAGLVPDLLAGHSMGEWTAMVVAGMYPRAAVDGFLSSLRPDSLAVPDLVYAAVGCGVAVAERHLLGADSVVVSHDNCPNQSVLCGPAEAVAEVLGRLRRECVVGGELPFRSGFHTPMWAPYLGQVADAFEQLPLREPRVPVWSATGIAPYPAGAAAVRELTVRHLLEPVRFRELIEELYAHGVRVFVQPGAGSLVGFVHDTLRGCDALAVAAHSTLRPGLAGFRRATAALWVEGAPIDPAGPTETRTSATEVIGPASTHTPTNRPADPTSTHTPMDHPARPASTHAPTNHSTGPASTHAATNHLPGPASTDAPTNHPAGRASANATTDHSTGTASTHTPTNHPAGRASTDAPTNHAAGPTSTHASTTEMAGPVPMCAADSAGAPARDPAPASAPAPSGPMVRLDLGSPVVTLGSAAGSLRLTDSVRPTSPAAAPASGHPVLAAFRAVLAEADRAVTDVVGPNLTGARVADQPHSLPAPAPTDAERRRAYRSPGLAGAEVANLPHPLPPAPAPAPAPTDTQHGHPYRFSLAEFPYVRDHCVYEQPDWWPEPADRFPVLPMTTLILLAGEAAVAADGPGRVIAGYRDVRSLRWLPVAPPTDTELVRTALTADRVRIGFGHYMSAEVLLADHRDARPAPPADRTPLTGEGPAPVCARDLYRERWMFHGPGFAGIDQVLTLADDGIRGLLRALPAPGALLDAAGQLMGHWMQLRLDTDRLVFPMSVAAIDEYGPPPPPGAQLLATARIREVRPTTVRGDVELVDPATGAVRIVVRDWVYRRFAADERVWPMKFTPHTTGIAEPQPEGWCLLRTRWPDPAAQDLVTRRYLDIAEQAEFAAAAPRERRGRLLGRVAVKDAVRQYLWARGHGPLYPAQVRIGADDTGRPLAHVVVEPGTHAPAPPHVSVAHSHRLGVAAASAAPIGIDIALLDPTADVSALEHDSLTTDERRLLDRLVNSAPQARHVWLLRFRCAKEAAGRAHGTDPTGRPTHRVVTSAHPTGPHDAELSVRTDPPDGAELPVHTRVVADPVGERIDRYVVAWTNTRPDEHRNGFPTTSHGSTR